ncbi:MAG: hypothetical protein LBV72_13375 [Tannerella sp.]|jgi:hypothetical protein|nr:hypothetical protein [Tannerella sp.]
MIQAIPLKLDGVPMRSHSIVGLYELRDKIACIHFAFGFVSPEEYTKDKRMPSYVLLDAFSADFTEHNQSYLAYHECKTFSAFDAVFYQKDGSFFLNTKRYQGFSDSIAKILEVRDTKLLEAGNAPAPVKQIYNDSKTYTFGDYAVRMASQFIMECRSHTSGEIVWKLKLSAYLYTEIDERNGILYFGTAGNGGRFYGVSLADGSIVFNYNTGGTVRFVWYKNNPLLADRKDRPVLLNPEDGSEIRQIDCGKFKFTSDQHMIVKSDRLYAIVNDTKAMYAMCVDL